MMMEILAWVAAALVFACFFMKTMVALRCFAIASNIAFIGYGVLGVQEGLLYKVLPILLLHLALLPLNLVRLSEVRSLLRSIRSMQRADPVYDFLVPFMTPLRCPAGTELFRKGAPADDVFILRAGTVALPEIGKQLGPGALFGEVAIFSGDARRTASAICASDCELLRIAGSRVLELFYQDRLFSFKIARLLAGYA